MNELRRDPITGRWIIGILDKIPKPEELAGSITKKTVDGRCPFCWGQEGNTPSEIIAHRKVGGPNTPGWSIRVVPNKFPALKIEGELTKEGIGVFDVMNGIGAHEVIVETPDHFKDMADLNYAETEDAVWAYVSRSLDLRNDKRFKYVLIFKNHGMAAGASLEHSHSQLIALPVVPKRVREEIDGAARYFEYKERCVYCDMIRQERQDKERIIYEDERFMAFCPYVSRFPYEIWVMPKTHTADFTQIQRDCISCFAKALRDSLLRLKILLSDPPYNYIVHTSPINGHEREDFHWHIEIMPKLTKVAGFEWGSGFYINPVPPHIAAGNLLSVKIAE